MEQLTNAVIDILKILLEEFALWAAILIILITAGSTNTFEYISIKIKGWFK